MTLPPPTTQELREELHHNLIDLFADMLLLDCLLFAQRDEESLEHRCPRPVRLRTARTLGDYIEQHAGDAANIARWLLKRWQETGTDNHPT